MAIDQSADLVVRNIKIPLEIIPTITKQYEKL